MPIRIQSPDHLDELTRDALLSARRACVGFPVDTPGARVGAAAVGTSGRSYTGKSVRLGRTTSICAELAAVSAALSSDETDLQAVMVVRSGDGGEHPPLCGSCRQLLSDLGEQVGHEIPIYTAHADLAVVWLTTSGELLPAIPRHPTLARTSGDA